MPRKPTNSTTFGRNLLRLREAANLTQEQLAEAAGVSWRYLQQLEAGREANPSLQILANLKAGLKCNWEDLLGGIPS